MQFDTHRHGQLAKTLPDRSQDPGQHWDLNLLVFPDPCLQPAGSATSARMVAQAHPSFHLNANCSRRVTTPLFVQRYPVHC